MADLVKVSYSVTERQLDALRAEAKRRGVSEGEVMRGALDFWIDAAAGRTALCTSVLSTPMRPTKLASVG